MMGGAALWQATKILLWVTGSLVALWLGAALVFSWWALRRYHRHDDKGL